MRLLRLPAVLSLWPPETVPGRQAMAEDKVSAKGVPARGAPDARRDRLAAALRENLQKRKAQARARRTNDLAQADAATDTDLPEN